ncbi:MAG: NAD-dependent malic enzyme [Myxococcales bacterium]|nr:NAD-dependent malic enzyme [Myxococcales bacterium]
MSRVSFEQSSRRVHVRVPQRGRSLLSVPLLNKGTAFTREERRVFGLDGILPSTILSIDQQARRAYESITRKAEPLERYIGMAALQDRNETLFYRLLVQHTDELMPVVYTPTVGEACQKYSRIFRRARGVWITPEHKGRIAEVLATAAGQEIRLIVATDNERILGLGDQGAGGIGIPIGKLALYTAAAGIHPSQTLPISLDVGTDNEDLLEDDLYIGYRHRRLRGAAYDELLDEFVEAVKRCFPRALVQWEDFKKGNAFRLLERHVDRLPSFNDDIQGTAAVALAGVMAACRARREPFERQRVVILGAGAAGVGIARQLRDAFGREGVTGDDLVRRIAVLDSKGLLVEGNTGGEPHKDEFAWPRDLVGSLGLSPSADLPTVITKLQASVLIGTSGQPGVFGREVVEAMVRSTEAPAIFPLSNPTSKSEATPADVITWSDGRALVATGSPFEAVTHKDRRHRFSQANNVYVFPGVGLGALVAQASRVTDSMFTVAARELAASVSEADLGEGALFPPLSELRDVTARVAAAVVREARDRGLGRAIPDAEIDRAVVDEMWFPDYPELEPV